MKTPRSLAEALDLLGQLPTGTALDAEALREWMAPLADGEPKPVAAPVRLDPTPTWRERLWLVPAETRLGRAEVCEALGRSDSWLYKLTAAKGIPCRRLDGELAFLAGELRAWIRAREETVSGGESEPAPWERSGLRLVG